MTETLAQALQLTVLGMGMTFASIGALALGMLAMTYLTRGREQRDVAGLASESESQIAGASQEVAAPLSSSDSGAARAAAAAVAVAVAEGDSLAVRAAAAAVAVSLTELQEVVAVPLPPVNGAWDSFVRSEHLSGRARYESRRPR